MSKGLSIGTDARGSISAGWVSRKCRCPACRGRRISWRPIRRPATQRNRCGKYRVKPRSIRALAIAYYDSAAFKALKPITKGVYRKIIVRFCQEVERGGGPYGDKGATIMMTKNVAAVVALRSIERESQQLAQ